MKFLGYDIKNMHHNYYDASDVYWNESMSAIMQECKRLGFKIVKQGGLGSCFTLTLKKI